MRAVTNIFLYQNDEKIFGEGPCQLLRGIEMYGSLRAAAAQMNLSYSKATRMMRNAENALGFSLTEKTIGGKGGGGSRLTVEAKEFLERYEAYRDACVKTNQKLFEEMFDRQKAKVGCIVMASGVSRRFGENKLLADFQGQTLFERAMKLTEGELFARKIVLTRTKEVAAYCEERSIPVILHNCDGRGDAIRLGIEQIMKDESLEGCLFLPCDQPLLERKSLEKMVEVFGGNKKILQLGYGERKGAPVLFSRKYFEELCALPEKSGGSYLMKKHPEDIKLIFAENEWELEDIDTKEDYERLVSL